jgi:23S rRNA pseudouridine1911/1915/1917 synthase
MTTDLPRSPFTAELIVESYLHGVRIDSFLVKHFRNYTPFRMQRLVRAGQVKIEGATAQSDDRVYEGQAVRVRLLEPPDHLMPPEPIPLDIVYEDPWLIAVNKPAGIVVHPCGMWKTGSLANALQYHFDQQTQLRGLLRPGVVHRLDRLTSGIIVLTKDHLAHRKLSIAFQSGYVTKTYLALVHGVVERDRGEIDLPIGATSGGGTIRRSVEDDAEDARESQTRYEVVERFARHSLVRCQPLTGRLHQIRVHLAGIGHPVLADEFYSHAAEFRRSDIHGETASAAGGNGNSVSHSDEMPLLCRQALHAQALQFQHPITRQPVRLEAPLAADMHSTLEALRNG